ncbi:MAG: hypothetical protein AAF585_03890 [Verrucomicrobiota bacterium]
MMKLRALPIFALILICPVGAFAQDTEPAAAVFSKTDIVWILTAAILVLLMQVGFCMLEMGFSRAKNTLNVAMKNVMDFSVATLAFLLIGFTLMFGTTYSGYFGQDFFSLLKAPGDSQIWIFWFFQAMFAATACTIASGAMAERTR